MRDEAVRSESRMVMMCLLLERGSTRVTTPAVRGTRVWRRLGASSGHGCRMPKKTQTNR
ncbi:ribulose-phosphate 3-epimerase [Ralstonia solanacearum]|nr:ribulose-phosphate 3-epimerase [Ralstonia solanacearum]